MIGKTFFFVALLSLAAAKILSFPSEYRTHISMVQIAANPATQEADLEFRGNVSTYIKKYTPSKYDWPAKVEHEVKRFDFNTLWSYQIHILQTTCTKSKFEAGRSLDEFENPISWTIDNGVNTLMPCFLGNKIGRKVKCVPGMEYMDMCVTLDGTRPIYYVGAELQRLPPLLNIDDVNCKSVSLMNRLDLNNSGIGVLVEGTPAGCEYITEVLLLL
ncbi:hypothetical protein PROFUN_09331 [Planoprotostelium fungivorum]|uniref:Uncharacterized protein n=1 Tax=Planoprotostelium fungivorum TaxID=1890364 RepID=A0A2P6NHC2_9EUKA|nr:hypothetical protein PROFUN_09331 [Planoprotostelium fungivorum]